MTNPADTAAMPTRALHAAGIRYHADARERDLLAGNRTPYWLLHRQRPRGEEGAGGRWLVEFGKRYHSVYGAIETRFVDDQPARAINSVAGEMNADLIVMGTHARRGVRRAVRIGDRERPARRDAAGADGDARRHAVRAAPHRALSGQLFGGRTRRSQEASAIADAFHAESIVMHVIEGEPSLIPRVDEQFATWVHRLVRGNARDQQDRARRCRGAHCRDRRDDRRRVSSSSGAADRMLGDSTVIGSSTRRIIRAATRPVLTVVHRSAVHARQVA